MKERLGSPGPSRAPRTDYEAIAPSYDEDRQHWEIPPDDVIAAGSVRRVLDVGCGTGLWLAAQGRYFTDAPIRWTGLDPSAAMLAHARGKLADAPLVHAFAEAIPFVDASFDYVYSSFVYHHFSDKQAAFAEIARVLRAGGMFRIRHIDPPAMRRWWVYEFFPPTRALDELRFWTVEALHDGLEGLGFDVSTTADPQVETRTADDVVAEARRRVVSQLAILDDTDYEAGLARLNSLDPAAVITSEWAGIALTAVKR